MEAQNKLELAAVYTELLCLANPADERERDRLAADDFVAAQRTGDEDPARPAVEPGQVRPLDQVEREMIERALAEHAGNLTRAAEALGLSRGALYRRLEKHGIEP